MLYILSFVDWAKSLWLVIDSGGEPRAFILLNGHSNKLAPKFLSLNLYISLYICAFLKPHQRSFFLL